MRIDKTSWLITKPIAHRGLWGENIVENSITAYENATKFNYPIEIDVYLTTDNEIVCFHDEDLMRMTGVDGKIFDKSYAELMQLNLLNTTEKIPTLKETLKVCEGKSQLLIEIKDQPNEKIVDKVIELLKGYKGEFAIQSFNPLYINKVKKIAPEFIRGLLSKKKFTEKKGVTKYILEKMKLNWLIKPDFISYLHEDLPIKKSKTKNKVVLAWTITSQSALDKVSPYCNNVIFEHFIPQNK